MTDRIQKVLARAGVGSRRQVEQWVREGRLTVNGAKVTPGTKIGPRDRIALDGRAVRLSPDKPEARVTVYHRAPKSGLKKTESDPSADLLPQLPGSSASRWVAISPMPVGDGGLELLTTDGDLSYALTRRFSELRVEFALRVLGDPRLDQLEKLKGGVLEGGKTLRIESLELEGGEGANRWFKLNGQGIGGRDVHHLCTAAGLQLSRLMRVALGPVTMDRSLSRGRTRPLEPEQMAALYAAAGLAAPKPADESPPKRKTAARADKPGRVTRPAKKKKRPARRPAGSRTARR